MIGVVGTSMNSGKTLATAQLVLGLRRAGFRVGAIKITGTGAFGDFNEYADSGAHYVADFTDAGMVTTYREPLDRIKSATETLVAEAGARGCDIVVMEVADGLLQRETAAIIADPWFKTSSRGWSSPVAMRWRPRAARRSSPVTGSHPMRSPAWSAARPWPAPRQQRPPA